MSWYETAILAIPSPKYSVSCAILLGLGLQVLSQGFLTETVLLCFLFVPILVLLVLVVTVPSLEVFSEVIVRPLLLFMSLIYITAYLLKKE